MKEFDWNEFKKGNITIHCKTKSEANDFCRLADVYKLMWSKTKGFSYGSKFWEIYKENTCYSYEHNPFGFGGYSCDIEYYNYNLEDCTILEWSDYMDNNNMPELKLGMIVENENQDRFLVLNYDISTDTVTLINSQNTISIHEFFVKSDTIYKVYKVDDLDGNTNELLINKDKQLIWERKQQLYNAKIVCIDDKGYSCILKGKIYEIKDGKFIFEDGSKSVNTFNSLEEINNHYCTQFIELVD